MQGFFVFFFFEQKTAYEIRISDWSSDVCSSGLRIRGSPGLPAGAARPARRPGGQSAAGGELPDPANRTAGDAMNPLDRLSSFYYRIPALSLLSRLSKPGLRRALAVVVAIVLLLLLLWIAIGVLPFLPLRFWQLAGLCGIAAAVLLLFLVGAQRYSRRGFRSTRTGDQGPGQPAAAR